MRKLAITTAAALGALAAFCVFGEWVYEGKWGTPGKGNGEFFGPTGIAVAPNGNVYFADTLNHRVQYFTPTDSYLGKWGSRGSGKGQFQDPRRFGFNSRGDRVYVADCGNSRIQYFKPTNPAVAPASLGRVKVLFR